MVSRRFLFGIVACALVAVALVLWYLPSSSDFAVSNPYWNGLADTTREFGIHPLTQVGGVPADGRGTAVLIIPARAPTPSHLQRIKHYVEGGGIVILLDDFGHGNDILMFLASAIRFSGQLLADPLFNLRNSRLPRILDFAPSPLTVGVEEVVFNHATVLTGISATQAAAVSSVVSYLDVKGSGRRDEGDPGGPFPVVALEPLKDGYLVVVADPSILINSMLAHGHNRRLLHNAVGLAGANVRVYLDDALLDHAPLDIAQDVLADTRRLIAGPAAALALTVAALVLPLALLSQSEKERTG